MDAERSRTQPALAAVSVLHPLRTASPDTRWKRKPPQLRRPPTPTLPR